MSREQKTKSKASQKSKQRVVATQVHETMQTTADATINDTQMTNNITTTSASDETISAQQEQGETSLPSTVEQSNKQVVWVGLQPTWQSWPTSKPGPRSTPPIPGTRPINRLRPEQFKEVGYNQQTGEPAAQSPLPDQPTAQDVVGKRKQRL